MARLFCDVDLAEVGRRSVDRLSAAIDAGDAGEAKRLAQRMYQPVRRHARPLS